jgi:integrase
VVTKVFSELVDATTWVNQSKAQVSLGTWVDPSSHDLLLSDFVETWRSTKTSASGKTLATYRSQLKNHILPHFGGRKLTAVSTSDIRNWVAQLEKTGIGSVTIRQSYRLLHQIFESALVDELIVRNPATGVRLPKGSKKKLGALSVPEVQALADECGKYSLLVKFLALTGMRVNEALAIRIGDLDFAKSQVHVSRTWTSTESGKRILGATKTREVRNVPLAKDLQVHLEAAAAGKLPEDWLFTGLNGDALDYGYFRRAHFEPAVKRLGFGGVTIHTLRHTCASLLIMLQAPVTTVSQILGHSSVKMTLDTYGHYYKDESPAWIEALGEKLNLN